MDLSEQRRLPAAPVAVWSPHPLQPAAGRELIHAELYPGETLGDYLRRIGLWPKIAHRAVRVAINGAQVPRSMWPHCRPKPGTLIEIRAAVAGGGGGGGKNPLKTVLSIALMVMAPQIAFSVFGAAGQTAAAFAATTFGKIATIGVGLLGSIAINAVFPPPKPNLSRAQGGFGQESPTYSLSGGSNRMRPYEPMPVIMGVHRVFPDAGAKPYTEFEGEDQYLYQVFDFGYNDLELSDYRIGATPLVNFSGYELQESGPDGKLTLFPANVDAQPGAALTAAGGWIQRTSSIDATALAVEITGAQYSVNASTGQIGGLSRTIQIEYRAVGSPTWLPFGSSGVTFYYTHYWSAGRWLEDDEGNNLGWRQVDSGTTIFGDHTEGQFYGTEQPDPEGPVFNLVWRWRPYTEINGGTAGGALTETAPVQSYFEPDGQFTLTNASRKPVRRTFRRTVAAGQYEVRVLRVSPDDTGDFNFSELAWSALRTYQPDAADYTGRKRVALKIKASGQLNGQVDQFSAIAKARTEVWNGAAWVTQHTSNPAWWVLAAARGKMVGGRRMWGAGLDDARIGLDNLKDFGAWCDAKGLSFNGVFDQPISVQDMLDAIALCGRGTVSNGSGKLEAVWDAPDQPVVAVIGMSNIKLDSFEIEYTTEQLADEFVLSFINPELDWQRDVVRQLAPGVTTPLRSRQIELFGCTSKDQAGRAANLYIATNEFRARRYKWRMDWEAMPLSRGEVAAFSHDLASYDFSGRLIAGSTASVLKLERQVPLDASGGWVTLVKPDGTFATHAVQAGVGDSDTLTLAEALAFNPGADPDHPPCDYRWLYGHSASPGRKVKIDAIRPVGYDTVELTAIDEDPEFYQAESDSYLYNTTRRIFGTPEISNLQLVEDGVRAGNGYLVNVTAFWDAGNDYSFAEVRVSVNGGPLELYGETRGRSFDFTVNDRSTVLVEVTAWSSLGRLSGRFVRASATKAIDFAGLFRPSAVASFGLSGGSFNWPASAEVDVVGYRIRFHLGNRRTWDDASPLHDGLITESPYTPNAIPSGLASFGIKAVDAAGLESADAAWVVVNLGDPAINNVIETIDLEALGFPGTITGGSIVGGDVVANLETAFYGPNDAAPIYTTDGAAFYPPANYSALAYETIEIIPAAPLAGSRLTIAADLTGDPLYLEYRQVGPAPLYSGEDADPLYTADSDPFYAAPPGYVPWPGFIVVNQEPYQFRVRAGQGGVEGRIETLVLEIDAPDIEQDVDNLSVSPGGTRVALTRPFSVIKNIQLTLEDDGGAAVSARWLDKSVALGPLIECIDETQSSVAGRVDVRIKGY